MKANLSFSRKFFTTARTGGRFVGGDYYRPAIWAETSIALILTESTRGFPRNREELVMLVIRAGFLAWVFHSAHTIFEERIRRDEAAAGQMSIREFYERENQGLGYVSFGPRCWIVRLRGFFLLNTTEFVEILDPDQPLSAVAERAEDQLETTEAFAAQSVSRNDTFGSRRKAPFTTNEGLRDWTFMELQRARRSPVQILSELMAAGVTESGARNLVAAGMWFRDHPREGLPNQDDLKPYAAILA